MTSFFFYVKVCIFVVSIFILFCVCFCFILSRSPFYSNIPSSWILLVSL